VHPFLNGADEKVKCNTAILSAKHLTGAELYARHVSDYQHYFRRVSLFLGENEKAALPTDDRLRAFLTDHNDPALYALLFQYGRYLLISSSRPGTRAANLQGIWNKELRAPWSSNYTININTQMNYWPVFSCGLGELNEPLRELIKGIAKKGVETAGEMYGARGFTSHHNSDIWNVTWAVGNHKRGTGIYAAWNMSAAWLCRHLFDEYEYSQDRTFLEQTAYPIMKEAALFLLDILVKDEKGRYMVCPSTSPENSFIWEGKAIGLARTSTMTMAMVKELFNNCITACNTLGKDREFAEELRSRKLDLFPFLTGSKGQLLEWDDEYEEKEPHHRHTSHLYGLHPSNLISPDKTPELADACRRTLELRGDDGTGWSLAWKVNFWARLWDGNHALAILNNQLRFVEEGETKYGGGGGTYPNMFDAHPPFQIDGNFGVAAGIAEMLLQNMDGGLHLLPALPDSWKNGHCIGLCGKKQIKVDIFWDGDNAEAVLSAPEKQQLTVYYRGKKYREIVLPANEKVKILL
jgi:alpha-L-fucosidase 2